MRVKQLRAILDGPFLLADDHRTSSSGSEPHTHDQPRSHSGQSEAVNDRAERED
jgi:hypothetical protein